MSEKVGPDEYLGKEVIVRGGHGSEWRGIARAYSPNPTVLLETEIGGRITLPAYDVQLVPEPKPWAEAEADEVWMFEAVAGLRLGQRALAWRGTDMLWDVIDPKGKLIPQVEDPVASLIEYGFESFEQLKKASRYVEVVSDGS